MSQVLVWGAALSLSIDGVDRTADLIGAGEIDRELDASGIAVFRLARGSAKPARGAPVAIGGIVATTYAGWVSGVRYEPGTRVWVVSCSDRLQAHFEALGSGVAVVSELPAGAIWHEALHDPFSTGWDCAQKAMGTIPYSMYMEGGALCFCAWAGTGYTSTIAHAGGGIYDGTVTYDEATERDLVSAITAKVQIIYTRLHHWSMSVGWVVQIPPSDPASSGPVWSIPDWDFGRWLRRPFSLPSRQTIADAASDNSWSLEGVGSGILSMGGTDGRGIRTEGLPRSGIYLAGQWLPMDVAVTVRGVDADMIWIAPGVVEIDGGSCINASFNLGRRASQTIEEVYNITVRGPGGTVGAVLADESASYTAPCDDAAWDNSGAVTLPVGSQWLRVLNHTWCDVLTPANRILVVRGMAQIMATRIRAAVRKSVIGATVEPGSEPDLGSRCRITAADLDAAGQVVALHTRWDSDSGSASCAVVITPSEGTLAGDTLGPPAAPDVSPAAAGYSLPTSMLLGTHIGGLFDSLPQDDTWDGWVGQVQPTIDAASWLIDLTYPRPGSESYQEGFVVRTPDLPAASRDDQIAEVTVEYEIATLAAEVTITP